jgi:HK97 family phage portal protein
MEFISLNIPRPEKIKMDGSSTLASPSADLVQALLGFPAAAGKPVTRVTATRVAAFLSGVKMLANDTAKMPLILRETLVVKGHQRTQPAIEDPLYPILKDCPNDWQTSYQLRWFLVSQLVMQGNCYCQKITDQAGDIIGLNPLDAWNMAPHWNHDTNPPTLTFRHTDGLGKVREFKPSDLWHVTNTNIEGNGVVGASVIALAKEALSVLMAAEETAGRNFANGLGMGGFISFPAETDVDEKQAQKVVDDLKKNFSGSQNAGKFSALPGGGTWQKMTFNAQESQLLESRKWNEQEVVRLLGGAPLLVKLGLSEKENTYASSSAFLDEYFNTSLLPLTTAIEQSITRDLIKKADRGRLYAKHSADIILRGSPKERAETNKTLIESTQMTPNEARILEDRDTVEGGDVLIAPANSCVFNPEENEWFIPGQKPPEESAPTGGQPPKQSPEQEPDAEGSGDGNTAPPAAVKPKPTKTKARLEVIANSLAERIMRKEAKGGIDAKFIAEVMSVSVTKAEEYIANRKNLSNEEARAALIAIAQGE